MGCIFNHYYPILELNLQLNYFACELNCVFSRFNRTAIYMQSEGAQKMSDTVNKVGNIKSLKKFVISSFPAPWVAVMLSALRWETAIIQSAFKILQ